MGSKSTELKPLILISNDDSLAVPGIHRLVETAVETGAEVVVVAPQLPQSGKSASFTANGPLRIQQHETYKGARMFSVSGTPVDCVKLAMHAVLDRKPDLLLSGINHGSNAGNSCVYSGTIGAAMEGAMQGIPSVGYSLLHHSLKADFTLTLPFIRQITGYVLEHGLSEGVCLNVNFPAKVAKIEGLKVVRSARSRWTEEFQEFTDPFGKPFYWITGRQVNLEPEADDTDLYWLDRNYATIVPLQVDKSFTPAQQY